MLKIRTSPPEERKTTPMNAVQVQVNENIRMLGKLKERWDREKEEEERVKSLPTYHTVATIQVVEDVQTISTHHTPSPTGPINGDATTSTLEEETSMNIEDFKQVSLNDITTSLIDSGDLDFDNCTLPEVIGFLHKMSRDPTLAHLILPSWSISPMI